MAPRLELHNALKVHLGANNVYYQPPKSVNLVYPAIVYNRESYFLDKANNKNYRTRTRYSLTLISREIDDSVISKLLDMPFTRHERHFTTEGLHHDVFETFF